MEIILVEKNDNQYVTMIWYSARELRLMGRFLKRKCFKILLQIFGNIYFTAVHVIRTVLWVVEIPGAIWRTFKIRMR